MPEKKVLRGSKHELRLSEDQIILACQSAGCSRYIWNRSLEYKKEKWEKNKEKVSRFELDKKLVEWKQEKPWLFS